MRLSSIRRFIRRLFCRHPVLAVVGAVKHDCIICIECDRCWRGELNQLCGVSVRKLMDALSESRDEAEAHRYMASHAVQRLAEIRPTIPNPSGN